MEGLKNKNRKREQPFYPHCTLGDWSSAFWSFFIEEETDSEKMNTEQNVCKQQREVCVEGGRQDPRLNLKENLCSVQLQL